MTRDIIPGRIVWVRVGPRGGYKERPAVVLSAPDAEGNINIVVATTQIGNDPIMEIELPSSSPERHPLTNLNKRTVVCLTWRAEVHKSAIRELGGKCPPTIFAEIVKKLRALRQSNGGTKSG
ncbi:MAG: type II toxin-antitoxin system PemK/MazF family toxin [Thermoguttaceae bacterium]